jgi:hypothetical protein
MRALFGGGRTGGADAAAGAAAHTPRHDVEQAEVLREDQGLFGKVYILSLVEFYEAIGGRDGRLADSLLVICDTVFQRHSGPGDGFSRIGDDRYVFRFGGLDDRQSRVRAAAIIEEIGTKLLGEHFIKSGRFKAMLTSVGIGDLVGEDGDIDPAGIDTALAAVRDQPERPAAPEEPVWVRFSHAGRVDGGGWVAVAAGREASVQWSSLNYTPKKREIRWEAIEPPKKKDDDLKWEVLRRDTKKAENELAWKALAREKK